MSENGNRPLTAADLEALEAAAPQVHPVPMPEWGGTVYVREPNAAEGLDMDEAMRGFSKEKAGQATFVLLAYAMCDADGRRLFDSTAKAKAVLGKRTLDELKRLVDKAREIMAATDAVVEAEKNV